MATTFKSGPRDPVTGLSSAVISPGNVVQPGGRTNDEISRMASQGTADPGQEQEYQQAEQRYRDFLEATNRSDTNPYGNDNRFGSVTGIDPSKLDYTGTLGAANIEALNRLAFDQYMNPIGPDGNVRGMLREGSPTQYGTVTKDPNARFGPFNRALTGQRGLTIPDLMSFRSYSGPQVGINTLSGTSGPLFPTSDSDSDPRQAVAVPDSTTTTPDTSTDVADTAFDNPMNISTGTVPVGPEIDASGNVVAPGYATLTVNQDSPEELVRMMKEAAELQRANRAANTAFFNDAFDERMGGIDRGGARIDDILQAYNERYPITGYRSPRFTDEALDNPEDFQVQAAPATTAGEQLAGEQVNLLESIIGPDGNLLPRALEGVNPPSQEVASSREGIFDFSGSSANVFTPTDVAQMRDRAAEIDALRFQYIAQGMNPSLAFARARMQVGS